MIFRGYRWNVGSNWPPGIERTLRLSLPPNHPATGDPVISGTVQVGEELTALTDGIMDDDVLDDVFTYQWVRVDADGTSNEEDITDETDATYTLTADERGKKVKVEVRFVDILGGEETRTSAPTATLAGVPNTAATGAPTITGTAQVGQTLTAVTTGIMDADGLTSPTYTYQWIRVDGTDEADIASENSSTYTLVDADLGKTLKVRVTFDDDASHTETLTSAATATVGAAATGPPTVNDVAVTSTPASGTTYYLAGEVIEFTVTFSAPVTVTATPKFAFRLGAATRQAAYASGSDSAALVFARTVQAGEVDRNGISWNAIALALDGGTITQTGATTAASLTHAEQAPLEGHRVDAAPPMQVSASVHGMSLVLVYDEPLDPASMPATGAYTVTATVGATTTNPAVSEVSIYGIWVTLALDAAPAAGATVTLAYAPPASNPVQDEAGNDAPAFSGQKVNGAAGNTAPTGAPTITGTAQVGQTLTASTTGIADADGLTSPTYTYQWIRVGHERHGGRHCGREFEHLHPGRRRPGQDPQGAGDLRRRPRPYRDAHQRGDGDGGRSRDGRPRPGDGGGGRPGQRAPGGDLDGGGDRHGLHGAVDVGQPGLQHRRPAGPGHVGVDHALHDSQPHQRHGIHGAGDRHTTRTGATDGPPSEEMTGTPRVPPPPPPPPPPPDLAQVTDVAVTSTPASGNTYYLAGEVIEFTVTFSAPVTVTATPKFAFRLGAATRQAAYASGSDSKALVFARTVQAGEVDRNGISWNAIALALDGGTITQTGATTAASLTHAEQAPLEGHRVDAAPPMQVSASVHGMSLVLVYDEALDPASMPATGAYTVTATVGATTTNPAVSEVSIYGIWVTLTLDAAPAAGATVTLAYAPPASNPVQDEAGNDAPAFSGQKVNGAAGNTAATGAPTITGTAQVGQMLTAGTTAIMDADGLTSVSYTYQWIRVATDNTETNISSATASTYMLVAADQGTTVKVTVSFTDDANNPETLTSAATAAVSAAPNTLATGAPTITGTAQVGQTLTAGTTAIMDADGLTSVSYTYQWIRVATDNTETNISSATASTYMLVAADQGTTVKVTVSFTDDANNPETLTSAATAAVSAAPNTPATGAPTITGTAQVGQTLTASTTGIADANGLTTPTYTYQWIRVNGTEADIAGENSSTYILVDADLGTTLKVRVTFADDLGHTETLTSAATATVVAAATAALGQVMGVGVAPGNAQLVVTWTAVSTATGYTVQWMSGGQGYNTGDRQATVTSGSTTRYTIPSLTNGTEYTVRVIATRTGADDGPPSAEVTGRPTECRRRHLRRRRHRRR